MFRLTKWYLDCVSDAGDVVIAHCAAGRRGVLPLGYSSLLVSPNNGNATERRSMRRSAPPQRADGCVNWRCNRLGIDGQWRTRDEPATRVLYETPEGSVVWTCHSQGDQASIHMWDGRRVTGLGYVEELTLSIAPWKLPLDELIWGRFISDSDVVTWIEWVGSHPLRLVIHNGVEQRETTLSAGCVVSEDEGWSLTLEETRSLRQGPLGETAFAGTGLAKFLVPARVRRSREERILSRAKLRRADESTVWGWSIHERIRWE